MRNLLLPMLFLPVLLWAQNPPHPCAGSDLSSAAAFSSPGEIESLIALGANMDGESSRSPLVCASMQGRLDVVKLLLRHGARMKNADQERDTLRAAVLGSHEILGVLLTQNPAEPARSAALEYAIEINAEESANLLMKNSVPLKSIDERAALRALVRGYRKTPKLVFGNGLAINARNEQGETALMLAAGMPFTNAADEARSEYHALVSLLLAKGAQVNARSVDGQTPLSFAARSPWTHLPTIKLLLASGANMDAADNDGVTVLMHAAHSPEAVKMLCEQRANVHSKDAAGWTALHHATRRRNLHSVQILVATGAGVDSVSNDGSTPLMLAATLGTPDLVEFFLQRGADAKRLNKEGKSPMALATDLRTHEILEKWSKRR